MRGKVKKDLSDWVIDVIVHTTMVIVIVTMTYPILNILASSLSGPVANLKGVLGIIPQDFTVKAYKIIFSTSLIPRAFLNSVIYSIMAAVVHVVLCAMYAYPLSRPNLPLRTFYNFILIPPMFIGGGLIPTFLLIKWLGLYNTMWALVLPGAVGASSIIIMRTFFMEVPQEVIDAAYIDGASEMMILWRFILPLSIPIIVTQALFTAVGQWNAWFGPLIYLSDPKKYPLQLVLRQIVIMAESLANLESESDALVSQAVLNTKAVQCATVIVSIVPMLAVFPWAQKYFAKGVRVGTIRDLTNVAKRE